MITVTITLKCGLKQSELTPEQIELLQIAWKNKNQEVELPLADDRGTKLYFQTDNVQLDMNESWT